MTTRLQCDLALEQAQAVRDGLDLATRIGLGQIAEIAHLARTNVIKVKDDAVVDGHRNATTAECDELERLAFEMARILGHGRGASFGIGNRGVPMAAKRQYEVGKAIAKVVADLCNPGGRTVEHDGVTVRYTPDPVPKARISASPSDIR